MASSRWLGIFDKMLEGGKGRWVDPWDGVAPHRGDTILVALCRL